MKMKFVCIFYVICSSLWAGALDREAFTFTKYELNVRIEPEQQRLGVRGKIALRNDSGTPQRSLSLQISSSLNWSSIQSEGKPVEFVSQTYTSDVDHTGALSEAIVVLPAAVAPKQTIELEVGYEGVIPEDTTRLTRIGVPADTAKHSDWDQIGRSFTAVRGIGYVAWYPVATEASSLTDGNSVEETSGRWKLREADCTMTLNFESTSTSPIFFSGTQNLTTGLSLDDTRPNMWSFSLIRPGVSVPTFVSSDYSNLDEEKARLEIRYLPSQEAAAKEYSDVGSQPDLAVQLGRGPRVLEILGLPDPEAAPFATEGMLLTPLKLPMKNDVLLNVVYARARGSVPSTRAWIQEGLARYAQAAFVESLQSRQAALNYMRGRMAALIESEKSEEVGGKDANTAGRASLINDPNESRLQTKAMYIWWILRDMVGEHALQSALFNYKEADDTTDTYMQTLLQAQIHRDLQWFFDDWVYHDRGLPDFRIASVYPSALASGGYMVTVTVENLGDAGAEVPVTLHMQTGEESQRLVIPGKSKASVRIQTASLPQEVTVNDGSVPERDMSNNGYKIESVNH
jgi:hypothetical protein